MTKTSVPPERMSWLQPKPAGDRSPWTAAQGCHAATCQAFSWSSISAQSLTTMIRRLSTRAPRACWRVPIAGRLELAGAADAGLPVAIQVTRRVLDDLVTVHQSSVPPSIAGRRADGPDRPRRAGTRA